MQSMPIIAKVVSSNPTHGDVYSIVEGGVKHHTPKAWCKEDQLVKNLIFNFLKVKYIRNHDLGSKISIVLCKGETIR